MLPATTWPRVLTPGAMYCTPGTSRMASASSGVSELALPWPMRTPPCWKLPALTMIMLVPADWICVSIDDCAPVPSATIVITADTPMIMPSMVSAVRILLRASALKATRNTINKDMPIAFCLQPSAFCFSYCLLDRGQVGELVGGGAPVGDGAIGLHHAVAERHDARAVLGDIRFVRDQHDGDAALDVEALEQPHHLDAGSRIEVAGRLVGQQDRRVVDQRARDRHALLLSARQLVGMMAESIAQADGCEHLLCDPMAL